MIRKAFIFASSLAHDVRVIIQIMYNNIYRTLRNVHIDKSGYVHSSFSKTLGKNRCIRF